MFAGSRDPKIYTPSGAMEALAALLTVHAIGLAAFSLLFAIKDSFSKLKLLFAMFTILFS